MLRYPCDQCEHVATQKVNLQSHIKAKHEAHLQTKHKCKICPYETIHKTSLKVHYKVHDENPTYYECEIQGDFFQSKSGTGVLQTLILD